MSRRSTHLLIALVLLAPLFTFASVEADEIDIHPRKNPDERTVDTAAIHISRWGETGMFNLYDNPQEPGVSCQNRVRPDVGATLSIEVLGPDMYAAASSSSSPEAMHLVGWYFQVYQVRPDGSRSLIRTSDTEESYASRTIPMIFGSAIVDDLPVGPRYIVVERLVWYAPDEVTIIGQASFRFEYYVPYVISADGTQQGAVAPACISPYPPAATLDRTSGVPRSRIAYDLEFFPIRSRVTVQWDGRVLGTITTDGRGRFSGRFSVPVTTGGKHTLTWVAGTWKVSHSYTVQASMLVTPSTLPPRGPVSVALSGLRAGETIAIQWRRNGSWVTLATISAAKNGTANVTISAPDWATSGNHTLRAKGTTSQAKTTVTITP